MATGRSLFLLMLVGLTTHASADSPMAKCCPPGQIFSGETRVDCVPTPSDAIEFYSVADEGVQEPGYGFPVCEEVKDITTTPLSQFNMTDLLQIRPCVEILHIEATHEDVPTVAHCQSNKDRAENSEALNVSLPQLLDVRRCCPKNKVLNVEGKNCVSMTDVFPGENNSSNVHEFLSFLPKNLDTVDFLNVTRDRLTCSRALFTYEISAEDIVFEDGALQVTLPTSTNGSERVTMTERNACLELTTTRRLAARICRDEEFCEDKNCVRKCCPEDQVYNPYAKKDDPMCHAIDDVDSSVVFYETLSDLSNGTWKHTESGQLPIMKCKSAYRLYLPEIGGFIPKGGKLIQAYGNKSFEIDIEDNCLDVFRNKTSGDLAPISLVCFSQNDDTSGIIRDIISSVLQVISCVFLVLTLLVYICLPSLQNLHGKTLMCHAASLLLAYICLTGITWLTPDRHLGDHFETVYCATMGYTMFFAFLSTFSWLNVMCFDIWRTFGRLRGNFGKAPSNLKTFLLYCLYAWGVAILMTMIIVLNDEMPVLPDNLRPNFGQRRCWFSNGPSMYGELIFFRVPVAIQLISNVVFFILTSEHCSKVKAEIRRVADPSDPKSKRFHADKTKLIMNVKLFVVMGITWVAEIISSLLNMYTKVEWQKKLFYVSDTINCLQGLLIFILFVMKPRVYQALRKRLGFENSKKCSSGTTSTLQDPYKVKKSGSNSTLTSSFAVSSGP